MSKRRSMGVLKSGSCAGLTRASIFLRKRMDFWVKPGNEGGNGAAGLDH